MSIPEIVIKTVHNGWLVEVGETEEVYGSIEVYTEPDMLMARIRQILSGEG